MFYCDIVHYFCKTINLVFTVNPFFKGIKSIKLSNFQIWLQTACSLFTVYALVNRHSNVLKLPVAAVHWRQRRERPSTVRRCDSFPLRSRIAADANLLTSRKRRNWRDWLICALEDEMQASGRCSASGERLFVTDTTREPHKHKDADRHSSLASGSDGSWVTPNYRPWDRLCTCYKKYQ